jgi:hypothetical protein
MADQREGNDNANSNVENNLDENDFELARRDPDLEKKLSRHGRKADDSDLQENRNLTGSTTWETSPDQADTHRQHARKGQAQSPVELNHNEQPRKKEGHPGH